MRLCARSLDVLIVRRKLPLSFNSDACHEEHHKNSAFSLAKSLNMLVIENCLSRSLRAFYCFHPLFPVQNFLHYFKFPPQSVSLLLVQPPEGKSVEMCRLVFAASKSHLNGCETATTACKRLLVNARDN
jgi:hypothetical protein